MNFTWFFSELTHVEDFFKTDQCWRFCSFCMAYLIHLKKNAKLQKIFLISSKKSMLSPTPTPTLLMFYDMLWTENFDQLLSLKNKADWWRQFRYERYETTFSWKEIVWLLCFSSPGYRFKSLSSVTFALLNLSLIGHSKVCCSLRRREEGDKNLTKRKLDRQSEGDARNG